MLYNSSFLLSKLVRPTFPLGCSSLLLNQQTSRPFSMSSASLIESLASNQVDDRLNFRPIQLDEVSEADRTRTKKHWGTHKTAWFWSLDPKLSILKSTIDPFFTYRLPGGQERIYTIEVVGYGPHLEASIRVQGGWVFRAPVDNLIDAKPIPTSFGLDVALFGFHFTFMKFLNTFGGVFFFGIPFGLAVGFTPLQPGYIFPAVRHTPDELRVSRHFTQSPTEPVAPQLVNTKRMPRE